MPLGRGWYAHAVRSLPYGCGPVLLAAAVAGILIGARRLPRHTLIVAAFAAAYYAAIGSGYTVFFRYVMPLVPIVCLFAAIATKYAADLLTRSRRSVAEHSSARTVSLLVLVALIAFVAGPSTLTSVRMDLVLARTDTRVIAADWLGPQLRPEDTLHDAGGDYARLDLRDRRYHEWRFDPATQSFGHPEGLTPDWIVIADSPLRPTLQPIRACVAWLRTAMTPSTPSAARPAWKVLGCTTSRTRFSSRSLGSMKSSGQGRR